MRENAATYDHFELRLEVCSPVAEESAFDSGTLWGRIICALISGRPEERALAETWLAELRDQDQAHDPNYSPPLVISEGFFCDGDGEPWLPMPLAVLFRLQSWATSEQQKKLMAITRVPRRTFEELCAGKPIGLKQLLWLSGKEPSALTALQPHLSMNRYSGSGRHSFLFVTGVTVYSVERSTKPQVLFYIKIRANKQDEAFQLINNALWHICNQGWGHGKSRGLGKIRLKSFAERNSQPEEAGASGFVSLSHFSPASTDPTEGHWWLNAKHPVPAPFVSGKAVTLGEETDWRIKSFLRLQAGSCLMLRNGETLRPYYGRTLTNLLDPAEDREGKPLPKIFHYALSYPWPLRAVKEV